MSGDSRDKILFVSNMGDDSISVIDVKNWVEIKRIYLSPLENKVVKQSFYSRKPIIGPHSIKIDRNKQKIYSVNCYDDSISVIDILNLRVEDTFFAGSHPNDLVFSIDESFAYITNGDSDSVSIMDVSNKKIITQVSVGVLPHGICMSSDGEFVYTANIDSNSVSVIDTWSNSKVCCINVGECPIDVITSHDGRYIFTVCSFLGFEKNGYVCVISKENFRVQKYIEVGRAPVKMETSQDNNKLYVTNMGSNDIYIIDLLRFKVEKRITAGNMTSGIRLGDGDYIYVTNIEDSNVSVIDTKKALVVDTIEVGSEPTSMIYI